MRIRPAALPVTGALVAQLLTAALGQAQSEPMIRAGGAESVSDHVHVILDENAPFVPNVGIVVGERATLVIDTGLGEANGRTVLAEARRLSDNEIFYIAATHFHPEHDLGAGAFPDSALVVRWTAQQAEADVDGPATIERFAGFSPTLGNLLDDVVYRDPDVLFDESVTLDLGGVRVVATGVGPSHTRGDTVFWVEEDRVLFTGDVVMSVFPAVSASYGDLDLWLDNLERFNRLDPAVVVPAHGRLGGVDLIRAYRNYLETVRERVLARRRMGESLDAIKGALAPALADEFAMLTSSRGDPTGRINAAIEAAYRLGE